MTVLEFVKAVIAILKDGLIIELLLGVLGIMLLRVAYRLQRTASHIDFTALIVGQDNQVSLIKLMQFVGFIVVTWIVVVYTVRGTLTEWLFATYFAMSTGTQVINRFAARPELTPTTTTVTATVPGGAKAEVTAPGVTVTTQQRDE